MNTVNPISKNGINLKLYEKRNIAFGFKIKNWINYCIKRY